MYHRVIKHSVLCLIFFGSGMQAAQLNQSIQSLIDATDPSAHVGIMVYSLKDKKAVYEHQANKLFTPASTTKIATALTALHHVGSDYRFQTTLMHDGKIHEHTIKGNLYLKGSGDPSLQESDLDTLVQQLLKKGVTLFSGSLIVDSSAFDTVSGGPGRMLDDGDDHVSGLNINRNKVSKPGLHAGKLLRKKLAQHGIRVNGGVRTGKTPAHGKLLATHKSAPLSQLLKTVLADSDNLYSDCLFKAIAHHTSGTQGTYAKGTESVNTFLTSKIGLPKESFVIGDGSGSSRYNLLSPHQLVKMLQWGHTQHNDAFTPALSVSGVNGVLKERLPDLSGKVFGKTGRMSGVATLAGYFDNAQGNRYAFSIMLNCMTDTQRIARRLGVSTSLTQEEGLQDKICRKIVESF